MLKSVLVRCFWHSGFLLAVLFSVLCVLSIRCVYSKTVYTSCFCLLNLHNLFNYRLKYTNWTTQVIRNVSVKVTWVPWKQVSVGQLLYIPSQEKCGMDLYKNIKKEMSQSRWILHTNCFISVFNCLVCLKEMARENCSEWVTSIVNNPQIRHKK